MYFACYIKNLFPYLFVFSEEYTAPAADSSTDGGFIMVHHDERHPDQSIDDDSLIYDDTADPDHMDTTVSSSDPDQTTKTDIVEQDDNGNWNDGNDDNRSINWDEPYGKDYTQQDSTRGTTVVTV